MDDYIDINYDPVGAGATSVLTDSSATAQNSTDLVKVPNFYTSLEIDFELATGDARDFSTYTPQVFRFTAGFNRITESGLLIAKLTFAGHGRGSFLFFIAQSDFCSRLQRSCPSKGWVCCILCDAGNPFGF